MGSIVNLRRSSREAAAWGELGAPARERSKLRRAAERRHYSTDVAMAMVGISSPRPGLRGDGSAVFAHPRCPDWGGLRARLCACLPSAAGTVALDFRWQRGRVLAMSGDLLGAAVGLLFRTTRTIALRLLLAAAALNFLDAASELAGLHGNWLAVRFALGLSLGSTAALLIRSSSRETNAVRLEH